MERQLDRDGGGYLQRKMEELGDPRAAAAAARRRSSATARSKASRSRTASSIDADLVVVAAGIRPNVDLGAQGRPRREPRHRRQRLHGDVAIPTSSPSANASSTAASATAWSRRCSNRAKCWPRRSPATRGRPITGTVAGREAQDHGRRRLLRRRLGDEPGRRSRCATKIRALGIYKKLIVRDGKLAGVILVGDTVRQPSLHGLAAHRHRPRRAAAPSAVSAARAPMRVSTSPQMPDSETVCGCMGVTKGTIIQAIHEKGVNTLAQLKECTRASTGCGSCTGALPATAEGRRAGVRGRDARRCSASACRSPQDNLREILRSQQLKSVQEVLDIYGNGNGCEVCKPALSYMLDMLWCGDHDEDRSARFINDRVHANIQKDGTFSVVPRMRGGVTTPAELRRIADVADKYNVPMVKITGSQRIDLLGVQESRPAEGLGRPRHAFRPGLHQGRAHGEDLRRHRVLPLRHAGFHHRRHRAGAALREPVHAAQSEDGRRRLPAQLRRSDREGHRPRRPGRQLAGGGRRRGRQDASARPTC